MKKLILVLLLSALALCSYGQSARLVHGCVHGKGKTPIEGATISTVQGELICKTDASGQFQASTKSYITKIKVSHEGYGSQIVNLDGSYLIINLSGRTPQAKKSFEPVKKGYQQSIDVGSNLDMGEDCLFDAGLRYIGGYRINNAFFVGLGIGVDIDYVDYGGYYNESRGYHYITERFCPAPSMVMLPLFANVKAYLNKKRCQPFFSLSGGVKIGVSDRTLNIYNSYSLLSSQSYSRVIGYVEPAFGLNFRVSNKTSIYFQAGGLLQVRPFYTRLNAIRGKIYNRITGGCSFRFGCTF